MARLLVRRKEILGHVKCTTGAGAYVEQKV